MNNTLRQQTEALISPPMLDILAIPQKRSGEDMDCGLDYYQQQDKEIPHQHQQVDMMIPLQSQHQNVLPRSDVTIRPGQGLVEASIHQDLIYSLGIAAPDLGVIRDPLVPKRRRTRPSLKSCANDDICKPSKKESSTDPTSSDFSKDRQKDMQNAHGRLLLTEGGSSHEDNKTTDHRPVRASSPSRAKRILRGKSLNLGGLSDMQRPTKKRAKNTMSQDADSPADIKTLYPATGQPSNRDHSHTAMGIKARRSLPRSSSPGIKKTIPAVPSLTTNQLAYHNLSPVFMLSGISSEDRAHIKRNLSLLKGRVIVSGEWEPSATAVLMRGLRRSDKVVCAMAAGCWLLDETSYIRDSKVCVREFCV